MKKGILYFILMLIKSGAGHATTIDLSEGDEGKRPILRKMGKEWVIFTGYVPTPPLERRNYILINVKPIEDIAFVTGGQAYKLPAGNSIISYYTLGNNIISSHPNTPLNIDDGFQYADDNATQKPFDDVLKAFISQAAINREKKADIGLDESLPRAAWIKSFNEAPNKKPAGKT